MSLTGARSRFTLPAQLGTLVGVEPAPAGVAPHDGHACVTCGRPAGTPFCPHCGERRAADHAYTVHALAADVWDQVTPADGKSLRSLWALVRWPGGLTTAYMRGVRQPYVSPLRLFLLVNLAFFAFASFTGTRVLSTPLSAHTHYGFYASTARAMVQRRLAERRTSEAAYAGRFNATVETQARSLVVVIAPAYALLAAAVHRRRRRPVLHHLAFGFHAIAAMLVILMLGGTFLSTPLEFALRRGWIRLAEGDADFVTSAPLLLLFWAWLTVGFREAYGDGRWGAAVRGAALAGVFIVVLTAYRALLFFTAFWAT